MNHLKSLIYLLFSLLLLTINCNIVFAHEANLAKCESASNCILIDWKVDDVKESFAHALEITKMMDRVNIIELNDSYIHAEVRSKVMRYIDDFEVMTVPEACLIKIRSESRVGSGDFGVNRKRVINFLNELGTHY